MDEHSHNALADAPVPLFPNTAWTPLKSPLALSRVAIVTTAGLYSPGQVPWKRGDMSFRVLNSQDHEVSLGHQSANFDRAGFLADLNVAYPIDRLEEMRNAGKIGSLGPRNISFMGAQGDTLDTIRIDSGPAAAKLLRDDGVEVALLTPMCPLCTRTLGAVAHVLEAEGISTVMISLVESFSRRMRPPRVLHCNFPFGRALGKPLDTKFQHEVLDSVFGLLDVTEGPVFEVFPVEIQDDGDTPMTCEMPVTFNDGKSAVVREAIGLRAAYERSLELHGKTLVTRKCNSDTILEGITYLEGLSESGSSKEDWPLVTDIALDVRAYYEEAGSALADHVVGARQSDAWFFTKTEAGQILIKLQARLRDDGVNRDVWFGIVPRGY